MAPEAVTTERLYLDLKRSVMTGLLRPGETLITRQLAQSLGTSVTPVRDALHQLVGERLIAVQLGGGFMVPALEKEAFGNLYRWHADIMGTVIRLCDRPQDIGVLADRQTSAPEDLAWRTARLFERLALLSDNPEHAVATAQAGARLHLARMHEHVLGRCNSELHSLWGHIVSGNRQKARTALWHYHRRRLLHVDRIFQAMAANGFARLHP